jgi:hypothetical protein
MASPSWIAITRPPKVSAKAIACAAGGNERERALETGAGRRRTFRSRRPSPIAQSCASSAGRRSGSAGASAQRAATAVPGAASAAAAHRPAHGADTATLGVCRGRRMRAPCRPLRPGPRPRLHQPFPSLLGRGSSPSKLESFLDLDDGLGLCQGRGLLRPVPPHAQGQAEAAQPKAAVTRHFALRRGVPGARGDDCAMLL